MAVANGFISAKEARAGTTSDVIIHREISSIEERILIESGNGFLSATINNTYMTDKTINSPVVISSVNTTNNTITLTGVDASVGIPINFSSTSILPTPLIANQIYYLVPTSTVNVYKIAASKQNSFQSSPITIDIIDIGAGTHSVTILQQSSLYYKTWQNYTGGETRIYAQQMQYVIGYFTNLGYTIIRKVSTNSTFDWYITW